MKARKLFRMALVIRNNAYTCKWQMEKFTCFVFSLSNKSLSTKQCRKVYPCHFMTLRILIYFCEEQSRFLLTFLLWFNWMIFQKTFPLVFKQNYYDFVLVQTSKIHVLGEERKRWRKTRKYVSCFRSKKENIKTFSSFFCVL